MGNAAPCSGGGNTDTNVKYNSKKMKVTASGIRDTSNK